ncbi:MAG: hypothetical protein ACKOLA_06550 [Spartobacteria bacterium]
MSLETHATRTSGDFANEESRQLAPWAVPPNGTAGRFHPEASHSYRSEIQRDRARIIHCTSFRRLDGKTQVFLNGTGDHYRTRFTHIPSEIQAKKAGVFFFEGFDNAEALGIVVEPAVTVQKPV